jgi:hypothetical protein
MMVIEVVISLIFILLLLSILASSIMEGVARIFSLRNQRLESALRNMLGNQTEFDQFKKYPLYKQLQKPAYLNSEIFYSIFAGSILNWSSKKVLEEEIQKIQSPDLNSTLLLFLAESEGKIPEFRQKVILWYEQVMDRVRLGYKNFTKSILFFIGLALAVGFNVDLIKIAQNLSQSQESREVLVTTSKNLVEEESQIDPQNLEKNVEIIKEFGPKTSQQIDWGWPVNSKIQITFLHIIGWLLTATGIVIGAPFWFDLLKKILSFSK